MFNRRYIFIHGWFSMFVLVFRGVYQQTISINLDFQQHIIQNSANRNDCHLQNWILSNNSCHFWNTKVVFRAPYLFCLSGFNPSEKYDRQIGSIFPNFRDEKSKKKSLKTATTEFIFLTVNYNTTTPQGGNSNKLTVRVFCCRPGSFETTTILLMAEISEIWRSPPGMVLKP